jgi:N utilization substance protein A
MRSDFMLAINQLCAERRLPQEVVLEAVEAALISAYKRNFGSTTNIKVRMEPSTGEVQVFAVKDVVETLQDPKNQILLAEARQVDPEVQLEGTVLIESTPRSFGRIAAQTAKQVILQRIREAEREALFSSFADSAGEIVAGTIQSVDYHSRDVIVNLDGAEALLPSREQVPAERYRRGTRLRSYVLEVRRGSRGPQITVSRRTPALLRRLLELEVPEIFNGIVEIKHIAREAGSRSKVAVHAVQDGVDPVGSCVGVRGGRIQNVVNELAGEKIDVVQWHPEVSVFIGNALSPSKVMNVLLSDDPETGRTATVIVPDRQLSLAIGKEGQNARLAAKLTGWRIDIKSATETAEETLGRLEDITVAPEDMDLLTLAEVLLRKRETAEWDDTQQEALKGAGREGEEPLAWPGEEPVLEETPAAEVESEAADMAELAEPGVDGVARSESELAGATQPGDVPPSPASAELEVQPDAQIDGLDELEPPFDGEPIEDSLGWVITEPEEDYYSGWDDVVEETQEPADEWVKEEFEELADPSGPGKKKRKKSGRSKYARSRGRGG